MTTVVEGHRTRHAEDRVVAVGLGEVPVVTLLTEGGGLVLVKAQEGVVAVLRLKEGVVRGDRLHVDGGPVLSFGREEGSANSERISAAVKHGRRKFQTRVYSAVIQDVVVKNIALIVLEELVCAMICVQTQGSLVERLHAGKLRSHSGQLCERRVFFAKAKKTRRVSEVERC